jgi:hypothetical protein
MSIIYIEFGLSRIYTDLSNQKRIVGWIGSLICRDELLIVMTDLFFGQLPQLPSTGDFSFEFFQEIKQLKVEWIF